MENVAPIDEEKLSEILNKLSESDEYGKTIVRAKGMIQSAGSASDWLYFDMVPGEVSIRHDEPDATGKVCVIGADLNEEKLEEVFGK